MKRKTSLLIAELALLSVMVASIAIVTATSYELAYDDGVYNARCKSSSGRGYAVHFTNAGTADTLTTARFFVFSTPATFQWEVRTWTGSAPSTVIASGLTTPTTTRGWHDVDVGNVQVPTDFVIGATYTSSESAECPAFGIDYDGPRDRSWGHYPSSPIPWWLLSNNDLMIRAVLCDEGTPIPEFSTIVIPIASILGLLFFFGRRKRRNEEK